MTISNRGEWRRGGVVFLALALLAACSAPPAKPALTPPRIERFSADKNELQPGQSATLSWDVSNATEVILFDANGIEVNAANNTATVTPTASTYYLLRATGEGGRDVAFVQLAVGKPLERTFFVAAPSEVVAGEPVQLLFAAHGGGAVRILDRAGNVVPTTGESGVVTVTPMATTSYRLEVGGQVRAEAAVKVKPVIVSFTAEPPAARATETITFRWSTRGANTVTLKEARFGELHVTTSSADVANGSFEWTVPDTLTSADGGTSQVTDGLPLRFELVVSSTDPAVTLTRTLDGLVGEGPRIDVFTAPPAATDGQPVLLQWKTTNATKVQLYAAGSLIFETLPGAADVAEGSRTIAASLGTASYELVATAFNGLQVRKQVNVQVVARPQVLTFTLTPSVSGNGSAATATWTTSNASEVQLRLKYGPAVFVTTTGNQVTSGTTMIFPPSSATYELVALNAAGDSSSKEARVVVGSPIDVTAVPSPTTPGAEVTLTYTGGNGATEVAGIPTDATVVTPSNDFVDIVTNGTGQALVFDDPADGVAVLTGARTHFLFPLAGKTYDSLWVSTNGFLAFAPTTALPMNVDLTMTNALPPMLAPFWDDLELGSGSVAWAVDGTSFPRRLIVQWNEVAIAGDSASKLTFQVQLFETGQARFVYKTLTDSVGSATGASATVGYNIAFTEKFSQHSFNTATLADSLELSFFSSQDISGSVVFTARETRFYTLSFRLSTGQYRVVRVPVYVFGPESVSVSEAMPVPDPAFPNGHWVELVNQQPFDVDLSGLSLGALDAGFGWAFEPNTIVPARAYLVVGDSTNAAENGDAGVSLAVTNLSLAADGTAALQVAPADGGSPTAVSSLSWSGAMAGQSVQATQSVLVASGSTLQCTRTKTFNQNGNLGTPGAPNEVCFDYTLQSIPGGFEDLTATGTEVLATQSDYTGIGTVPLPAPFPYFGTTYNSVNLSMVGFLTFGAPLTAAYDTTNDTNPSTSAPNGVVAVFWDQIVRNTNGQILTIRHADHTIFSWQDFRIYASSGSTMNFQIKLFDSGVIELHYGTMTAGNKPNETTGSTATVWIEKPDGTAAMPVCVNTVNTIQPNSGYRFTPRVP